MQNLLTVRKTKKKYDYINLGSSYSYFAFQTQIDGIKGLNLAFSPQSLYYDLKMLEEYIEAIKENGKIFVVLCPFVFCVDNYNDEEINVRYFKILNGKSIVNYSPLKFRYSHYFSIVLLVKSAFFAKLRTKKFKRPNILKIDRFNLAKERVENWKKQFSINSFEDEINEKMTGVFRKNIERLNIIVEVIKKRGNKAYIIIPPITAELKSCLSDKALNNYLYNNIKKCNLHDAVIIDYLCDERLVKDENFLNADQLNKTGSELFLKELFKDLGKLK